MGAVRCARAGCVVTTCCCSIRLGKQSDRHDGSSSAVGTTANFAFTSGFPLSIYCSHAPVGWGITDEAGGPVAAARFQIFSVLDRVPVPGGRMSGEPDPPGGAVTWRFISANNRSLGRAVRNYPDVDSCLVAVQQLCWHVTSVTCLTVRDGPRHWVWRVRSGGVDHAVSSRRYERRVQAKNSCASFVALVRESGRFDLAQLVRFP